MVETCEPALAITKQLAAHLAQHGGCALAIDYGYTGGSRGDTLQALKNHQYHDVLQTPGEADLTAHVDFDALKSAATQADAKVYGAVPQGAWLMRLGAGVRLQTLCAANPAKKDAMISGLERIASPDQMGDLFKVLCITHPAHPKPEGF